MIRGTTYRGYFLLAAFLTGCGSVGALRSTPVETGEFSPAGDKHPGTVVFNDAVEGHSRSKRASEVPRSVAWVSLEGKWRPVVRIDIRGTRLQHEMTYFSPEGELLKTTTGSP